jgi:hypothetical protein
VFQLPPVKKRYIPSSAPTRECFNNANVGAGWLMKARRNE